MIQTPAETALTPEAEIRLADYLRQVRAALDGVADVSPDEIEADIREHVDNELKAAVRPVAAFVLEAVLRRLGPPTQWLPPGRVGHPGEVPSLGRYLRDRLRGLGIAMWRGPEDWRLPYLSFAAFALGVLAFPLFPLFLVISYVLSRAGVAQAALKGIELGSARKWLLYPPLAIVGLVLLASTTVGIPAAAVGAIATNANDADRSERMEWRKVRVPAGPRASIERRLRVENPDIDTTLDRVCAWFPGNSSARPVLTLGFLGLGVFTLWWAILGLATGSFPFSVRATMFPFYQAFDGRYARRGGLLCLLLFAIWCGVAYRIATDSGLV